MEKPATTDARANEASLAACSSTSTTNPAADAALIDAAKKDDLVKLNEAIQAGANVNFQTPEKYFDEKGCDLRSLCSAMHIASLRGCLPIVNRLLELKANCNILNERGLEPLYFAAEYGHLPICEILIQNGAVSDYVGLTGFTPIYTAAQFGFVEICELLIKHGAVVSRASKDGLTPLFLASQEGHLEVCELLFKNGADTNISWRATTPLSAASSRGHREIANLLRWYTNPTSTTDRLLMIVVVLQGLFVYYHLDCSSVIDLFQLME